MATKKQPRSKSKLATIRLEGSWDFGDAVRARQGASWRVVWHVETTEGTQFKEVDTDIPCHCDETIELRPPEGAVAYHLLPGTGPNWKTLRQEIVYSDVD